MSQIEVTCPSGLRVIVRGLKMAEYKQFSDRRAMKSGKVWDDVAKACVVEVLDPGPAYPKGVTWGDNALQGDRLYVLMAIRRATHGDVFDFSVACLDRNCRSTIKWRVNLDTDIPVTKYPEEAIKKHVAGMPFESVLGGRKISYGLLTIADEKRLAKFAEMHPSVERTILNVGYRCRTVEGFKEKKDVLEWIETLELGDVLRLRDEMELTNGGIETALEVECKGCGALSEVELPFGGKDFWTPKTSTASSTTSSSSSSSSAQAQTPRSGAPSSMDSATSDTEDPATLETASSRS